MGRRKVNNEEIEDFLEMKVMNGTATTKEEQLHQDLSWKGFSSFNEQDHRKTVLSLRIQYLRS